MSESRVDYNDTKKIKFQRKKNTLKSQHLQIHISVTERVIETNYRRYFNIRQIFPKGRINECDFCHKTA